MEKPIAVKDIMAIDIITFTPKQNVFEVIELLLNSKKSGGSVLDEDGKIVGFISEKDCLKTTVHSSYYDGMGALVGDLMSKNVDTLDANESIHGAAQKFLDCHYRRFPVVEDGMLVGHLSRKDILQALQSIPH